MAGGIDWFRWHHGSVTDPKFRLVARKSGARFGDVIAIWAFLLEAASASDDRGAYGTLDFESLDLMLDAEDGTTERTLDAMSARGLVADGRICAWEKRQPKREDDSAERVREFRRRKAEINSSGHGPSADVTPDAALQALLSVTPTDVTHCNARGEERREEKRREEYPKPNGFGESRASARDSLPPQSVEVNEDLPAAPAPQLGDANGGINAAIGRLTEEPPPAGMQRVRRRASRVAPQDFEVTEDLRAWAQAEFPGIDVVVETAKFRDHEFRDAHADWEKTWRNWIRKADHFAPRAASTGGVSQSLLDSIRNDPRCQGPTT